MQNVIQQLERIIEMVCHFDEKKMFIDTVYCCLEINFKITFLSRSISCLPTENPNCAGDTRPCKYVSPFFWFMARNKSRAYLRVYNFQWIPGRKRVWLHRIPISYRIRRKIILTFWDPGYFGLQLNCSILNNRRYDWRNVFLRNVRCTQRNSLKYIIRNRLWPLSFLWNSRLIETIKSTDPKIRIISLCVKVFLTIRGSRPSAVSIEIRAVYALQSKYVFHLFFLKYRRILVKME